MELSADQKKTVDWRRVVVSFGIKGGEGVGAIRLSKHDLRAIKALLSPVVVAGSIGLAQMLEIVIQMEKFMTSRESQQ